jgi:hypothetical protein
MSVFDMGAVAGGESSIELANVVIRETYCSLCRGIDDTTGQIFIEGVGVNIRGSHGTLNNALLTGNQGWGLTIWDGATFSAADIIVRDTVSVGPNHEAGAGLLLLDVPDAEIARALFERNRMTDFWAFQNATARLYDIVARDTTSGRIYWGGVGIEAGYNSRVQASRALFERQRGLSVVTYSPDSEVAIEDVIVRETLGTECNQPDCLEGSFYDGIGAASFWGAQLDLRRFIIDRSGLCGVMIGHGCCDEEGELFDQAGGINLHDGVVAQCTIGACVMVDDFDVTRLMDAVIWRNNGINLDSSSIPLPELKPPFEL